MASTGEDDQRVSVTSSIRMQRAGDAKIDTMSVVADIVAMGTRFVRALILVNSYCMLPRQTHAPSLLSAIHFIWTI